MFTFLGKSQRYCDGVSRRNFLKIGALGFSGLTLADLLRLEAQGGASAPKKAVINVFLSGGPSHLDMFDLKPAAPPEIRGEFHPIATSVPGIEICYLMPKLASMMNRLAIIRSLTGIVDEHSPDQTETGFSGNVLRSVGGRPSLGSVVAKLSSTTSGAVPTFMDLTGISRPGFLGPVYAAYRPDGPGRSNLQLRGEIKVERFGGRHQLLTELDRIRRDIDGSHMMDAMDSFNQQAVGVLTSSKLADALDLNKEDKQVRERYGLNDQNQRENERFLTARRLIEAGVRVVSLSWGGWDTHGDNFNQLRRQLPALDTGLSALVEDLSNRGMFEDVALVMWGEFGRTPRINGSGGRDHWSRASSALLAGGGLKMGQVIGSTNRYGEAPQDRPVHIHEIFATLYRVLGIDVKTTTLIDPNGRPQYLVEHPEVIPELV